MHNSRHSGKCFGKMVCWAAEKCSTQDMHGNEMYLHSIKFVHTVFESVPFLTRPFDMYICLHWGNKDLLHRAHHNSPLCITACAVVPALD